MQGIATEVSPKLGNRMICYCDDCQAFARFLGREDVLDASGGSDIFQTAQSRLRITAGTELLRCVRLSPKGLRRWYTECCHTPVANTVNGRVPLAGVVVDVMDLQGKSRDEVLGPPVGTCFGRYAVGGVPAGVTPGVPLVATARIAGLLLRWWLTGKGSPSPFYATGTLAPRVEPRVLTRAEREALRR